MKKEFKAPIIEIHQLETRNEIMDQPVLLSANQSSGGFSITDATSVAAGYKAWKGFKK